MSKTKVLIVTQEMDPYTTLSEISSTVRQLAPYLHSNQMEVRVLMPRYGTINERRHRLHEVVRLSGMNIIVDDDDYPLIIKVASLPGPVRMQVYFLDNEDFFKRKQIFEDGKGKPFADNADRAVFFSKGVIETVKKFGWPPDVIHAHGWMTSLIPFYLKTAYKNEPLFQNSKVVYSVYEGKHENELSETFIKKASINNLSEEDLSAYLNEDGKLDVHRGAVAYVDAVVKGQAELSEGINTVLAAMDKPIMDVQGDETPKAAKEFYQSLLAEEVEK
ncbi:starch synthase [Lewinellaceae bacterium SD302]|nr:starch synthase [Lewinellaceae bacterium SD302]